MDWSGAEGLPQTLLTQFGMGSPICSLQRRHPQRLHGERCILRRTPILQHNGVKTTLMTGASQLACVCAVCWLFVQPYQAAAPPPQNLHHHYHRGTSCVPSTGTFGGYGCDGGWTEGTLRTCSASRRDCSRGVSNFMWARIVLLLSVVWRRG